MKRSFLAGIISIVGILLPFTLYAHTPAGAMPDFSSGLFHPLSGVDHLFAAIAVGMLAARLPGIRALVLMAVFLSGLLLAYLAVAIGLPWLSFEVGITVSLIVMGAMMATGLPRRRMVLLPLVGLFSLFHGWAHAVELGAMFAPAAGMAVSTTVIVGAGYLLGHAFKANAYRYAGMLVGGAGVGLALF